VVWPRKLGSRSLGFKVKLGSWVVSQAYQNQACQNTCVRLAWKSCVASL
jgi:hypothetical protein